jgi:hypothetical protein
MVVARLEKAISVAYWWGWREAGSALGRYSSQESDLILIASPPRSGSSLLAQLLGSHRGLVRWRGQGQVWGEDYRDPGLPTELHAEELTIASRQRIRNVFSFFYRWHSRPVLIKQVHASLKLDAITEIFPHLRLVVLFRDGRASVESLVRTTMADAKRQRYPFGIYGRPKDFEEWQAADWLDKMCHLWRVYVRCIQEAVPKLPARNCIQVRYEALCTAPRREIQRIDGHLGLDPSVRDWRLVPERLENQNWKFQENMPPIEQVMVADRLNDLLLELGYSDSIASLEEGHA